MKKGKNLSKTEGNKPDPTPTQQNIGAPLGHIHGEAIIRGPDGKEKRRFTFGGPATPEQFKTIQREVLGNGDHTDNGSKERGV